MRRNRDADVEYVESVESVEPRRTAGNLKLSLIMCLLTLIGFILFAIFESPEANETVNNENRSVDEFSEEKIEITHPNENNATAGQDLQHLAVDDDGGYWVIEALLVPEEWK